MPVKIYTEVGDGSVLVRDLEPGKLAEIVAWSSPGHTGKIIQTTDDGALFEIGDPEAWPGLPENMSEQCRVRILSDKTLIEVNQ